MAHEGHKKGRKSQCRAAGRRTSPLRCLSRSLSLGSVTWQTSGLMNERATDAHLTCQREERQKKKNKPQERSHDERL